MQAIKDMDVQTLRKIMGNSNLPSWINFPGEDAHCQWFCLYLSVTLFMVALSCCCLFSALTSVFLMQTLSASIG